jgi:hypothetical protein
MNLEQGHYGMAAIDVAAALIGLVSDAGVAKLGMVALLGGADVAKGSKPFAMGIEQGLDAFANARGATTWKSFEDVGIWKYLVTEKLADSKTLVHFNLTGVDNVFTSAGRSTAGGRGATDWELLTIMQNPQWDNSIMWWNNGKQVSNPFR